MIAAITTGPETHLDHLAPLCFLLEIPLILTDDRQMDIAREFYPMIDLQYIPLSELTLDYIANHFDTTVTCGKFWAMELKPLIKLFFNKELRILFAPHGNSDKEAFLDMPITQDIDLVYGPQMKLLKKGRPFVEIGNLRWWFYQNHKTHFDHLAEKFFVGKKTILYAPTWESKASTTSFFEQIDGVTDLVEKDYNLLVKLHPLLEENDPAKFYRILGEYENKVTFIQRFPAIYPLLEKTDIYLGDYSSIGYDFLTYNRPMFFLKEGGVLNQCGELFKGCVDNPQKNLSSIRQKIYQEAFGKGCIPEKIKENLEALLHK